MKVLNLHWILNTIVTMIVTPKTRYYANIDAILPFGAGLWLNGKNETPKQTKVK